jgi:Cu/Ag efflux protein CusF
MKRFLVASFALVLIVCVSCGKQSKTVNIAQPSPQPITTPQTSQSPVIGKPYFGTGQIKIINRKEAWVEIDHDEIKDLMPPMTMEYWIKDRSLLNSVRVGEVVDFTVVETGKGEYITSIKKKSGSPSRK